MSKLREKARSIDLTTDDDTPAAASAAKPDAPRTAIGAISASLAMGRGLERENAALRARVKDLEGAGVVEMLDAQQVVPSRWANRHARSFETEDFGALKDEIQAAGRNVQPIKVRRAGQGEDGRPRYEVVFGHRRHRACAELGLPVAAVVEDLDDAALFAEMDRENRQRKDLSPWEQGVMYRRALEEKLFPSLRRLADALGVQAGNVSTAVALASLPDYVVKAFGSPLELQYRWAAPLKEAVERDAAGVQAVAHELADLDPRPSSKEIFGRLVQAPGTRPRQQPDPTTFAVAGRALAEWRPDAKGGGDLRIRPGTLTPAKEQRLRAFLEKLLGV